MTSGFININQAAEFLGISKSTIYKMTMKRELPFYQPTGGKLYFKEEELLTFILSSKVEVNKNNNSDNLPQPVGCYD